MKTKLARSLTDAQDARRAGQFSEGRTQPTVARAAETSGAPKARRTKTLKKPPRNFGGGTLGKGDA